MTVYPTTERFPLKAAAIGTTYDIRIASPRDLPADATDVPILFVFDADMAFDLMVEVARLYALDPRFEKAFIVGVGYGVEFVEMAKLRTKDLTEPLSEEGLAALGSMTNLIGTEQGGAEAFLSFVVDELTPEIARRRPEATTTRSILFGHSLGGLFVSYALLTRPHAFATFLASSPSLWWNGFAVLRHLPDLPARLNASPVPPQVLIAVGAAEQDPPEEVNEAHGLTLADAQALVLQARMVDAAADFAKSLRDAGLPDTRHVAFADETHLSCLPAAMSRGLTVALTKRA